MRLKYLGRVYSVEEKMQVAPTLAGLTLSTWCSRNTETESRTQKESRFDDSSELWILISSGEMKNWKHGEKAKNKKYASKKIEREREREKN